MAALHAASLSILALISSILPHSLLPLAILAPSPIIDVLLRTTEILAFTMAVDSLLLKRPVVMLISISFMPIFNNLEQMHCIYQNHNKQTCDLPCVSVYIERLRGFRQEVLTSKITK